MAAIRDLNCGASFEKLKDLGCFDEEFSVYGFGYADRGEVYYLIDNDGKRLYAMKEKFLESNIYTSPIINKVVRKQVDSGTINDVNQQIKLNFAKELRQQYGQRYFEILQWISKFTHTDAAYELLDTETEEITGYFNP